MVGLCMAQTPPPKAPNAAGGSGTIPSIDIGKDAAEPTIFKFKMGGSVKPPRPTHTVDPEYSNAARKAGVQGIVVLWLVVNAEGKPRDIKVVRTLVSDLDQEAIEAVSKWKFKPATIDGHPVAVQVNIEVPFGY